MGAPSTRDRVLAVVDPIIETGERAADSLRWYLDAPGRRRRARRAGVISAERIHGLRRSSRAQRRLRAILLANLWYVVDGFLCDQRAVMVEPDGTILVFEADVGDPDVFEGPLEDALSQILEDWSA